MDALSKLTYDARNRIRDALNAIKDAGTEIDGGFGCGSGDLWVKIGGHEFVVMVLPGATLCREHGAEPPQVEITGGIASAAPASAA